MTQNPDTRAKALGELIDQVAEGWRVKVTNHDYCKLSGERVVTQTYTARAQTYCHEGETHVIREGGPAFHSRQARGKQEFYYQFPVEGEDFEVDGLTLRVYDPSHAYVNGRRAIVLTMEFRPPVEE